MDNQARNLNPHKPAKAAMWLFAGKYGLYSGGSMQFWDDLPYYEKRLCRDLVRDIYAAREEDAEELKKDLSKK